MNEIIQFKGTNCKNCYKCIRNCEVKAIRFSEGKARIMQDECVLCGKCTLVCPQNAKQVFSDLGEVKEMLARGERVYASVAPSYLSAFPGVSFSQLSAALKALGFAGVEETAIGAGPLTAEYIRLLEEGSYKNLLVTCCPAVYLLVEKYHPALADLLPPVAAASTLHARMLRQVYGGEGRVVFIGPCIAKKHEAQQGGDITSVLLFDEVKTWLIRSGIQFDRDDPAPSEMHGTVSRLYPAPGGIIRTIPKESRKDYKTVAIDGLGRCEAILRQMEQEEIEGYLIELSVCAGSCIEGPGIQRGRAPFLTAKAALTDLSQKETRTPMPETEGVRPKLAFHYHNLEIVGDRPNEEQIQEILHGLGKFTRESVLNCGACGYNTCWEKVLAVHQGKADLHMCLPYLREKAESLSNLILDNTPNAVFVADKKLMVREFNQAAHKILGLTGDEVGRALTELIPAPELREIAEGKRQAPLVATFQDEERGVSLDLSMVPSQTSTDYILIARDITREERGRAELEKIRRETIETTQRVIDKQMRVAQEIASLLGETTGETKAALTRLKRTIVTEELPG